MQALIRVLLVEDDSKDVELILYALDEYNLADEITVARDGVEALDYLYRRGAYARHPEGHPMVVLLDLKMPKLDGTKVLKQIKSDEQLGNIPVVILTSSQETHDLENGYGLGANAYVVKPVRFSEFINTVKEIVLFWTRTNKPPPAV